MSEPPVFLRLLGMAFLSLAVGYWLGLRETYRGEHPAATVTVGIVSNGGSCLILLFYGLRGTWNDWQGPGPVFMWASVVATGLVTAGLIAYGLRPADAEPGSQPAANG
ncbi:MAG TPA: hypothetical protein VNP72_05585 [Longimicrobium sp.]|nr:hypothetical protein [Longimicrobium sp.]